VSVSVSVPVSALGAFCLLVIARAAAGSPPMGAPLAPGLGLRVQAGTAQYEAEERIGSLVFNRERGRLRGVGLHGHVGSSAASPALPLELGIERWQGRIAYEGLSQVGLPTTTTTRLTRDRAGVRAERAAALGADLPPLMAGIGLWSQRWRRAIEPSPSTLALTETTRLTEIAAHLRLEWPSPGAGQIQARAAALWPWRPRLTVDSMGVLDTHTLRPGPRAGAEAALAWSGRAPGNASIRIEGHARYERLGASEAEIVTRAGAPAGISRYPGVRQSHWGLTFGLAWAL
jgi:hypothetical protein